MADGYSVSSSLFMGLVSPSMSTIVEDVVLEHLRGGFWCVAMWFCMLEEEEEEEVKWWLCAVWFATTRCGV